MGHLSFLRAVNEQKRVQTFLGTIRLLARRVKMPVTEVRWALKEEGDFVNKLHHFHFLLDGSNLPNKDADKLAVNFGKLWVQMGGGDYDVRPYVLERDLNGFQRAVNYITKVEDYRVPFSAFFNAGENCHLKFSDGLDRHIAAVCAAVQTSKEGNRMNKNIENHPAGSDGERAARIEKWADEIITDAKKRESERRRHNDAEMEKLKRFLSTPHGQAAEKGNIQ